MERIAVYPGTFDPITFGHSDVIKTSAAIFDKVVVGLLRNPQKKPLFSEEERLIMIAETVAAAGLANVYVKCFTGLTVEFARQEKATVIIRGLRLVTEYEAELGISFNNRILDEEITSILVPSRQEHLHISSSAVREQISFNRFDKLAKYVPPNVLSHINKHYRSHLQ